MKRLVLLNALLILLFASASAQNYDGFDEWERGDMISAKNAFEALYDSKKTKIVGAFGLGLIHSDERYPERDMKLAYEYVNESRDMYKELKDKQKKELTANKFKYTPIKALRDQILTTVITDAKNKNTEEDLNDVIQNFKLSFEVKKEMYRMRNTAALETAKLLNSYADFAKIYVNYERKDFTRYTPELADEIDLRLFESFVAEEGYDNLDKFKEAHSKSPFVSGSTVDKFIAASKEGKPEALEAFAEKYKGNSLADIAKKKAELMRDGTATTSIKGGSKDKTKAWEELQKWIKPQLDSAHWDVAARKMSKFEKDFTNYAPYQDLYELLNRPSDKVGARTFSSINSSADEYGICLTADNKTMYFCGDERSDGMGSEDIFVSKYKNGSWSRPKLVNDLCTKLSDAPLSVTADGTRMLVFQEGGIAYSDKKSKGWSKPVKFTAPINSHDWQADAQMTADGKGMIFVIFKNKHTDIYYAPKNGEKWGALVNLGKNVNTSKNERTPFLHPDMRTLYFSSDGHGGLGDMDVYMVTREGDSWSSWSKPVNLGKDINTTGKDWGYKITTDGKRAFFSSGSPKQNLYEIDLPERYRPNAVNLITSTVDMSDNKDKKIVVQNAETGEVIGEFQADPETGEVVAVVPEGVKTTMRVEGEGVVSRPIEIEAKPVGSSKESSKATLPGETSETASTSVNLNAVNIEKAIEEGQTYSFPDLLFGYDSDDVNTGFYGELDQIASALNESGTSIIVAGHTDNQGSDTYNEDLSQRRAEAVKTYLVSRGIDAAKIQAIGYGESQPVSDNSTKEGQAQNRRVEIVFKRP